MVKRVLLSVILAVVFCGVTFYLAYFIGLMYSAVTGPLNPANAGILQQRLRHIALPISVGVGVLTFLAAITRSRRPESETSAAKVLNIR